MAPGPAVTWQPGFCLQVFINRTNSDIGGVLVPISRTRKWAWRSWFLMNSRCCMINMQHMKRHHGLIMHISV